MLMFLQDLKGDNFDISEKFDKLWVDNCKDFKTVPAHVNELNIRNCASFEHAPGTVKKLTVENCPRYLPTSQQHKLLNLEAMNKWLASLNIPFEEQPSICAMQDELLQILKEVKYLESQLTGRYGSVNNRIRRFSKQP